MKVRILESTPSCTTLRSRVTSSDSTTERGPRTHGGRKRPMRHSCHCSKPHTGMRKGHVQALRGSWAQGPCVPHFSDCRKQPSFSLQDLPESPVGRCKQLLIRNGRGYKARDKQSRAALRQGPVCFSIIGYTQPLWAALQILTLAQSGRC